MGNKTDNNFSNGAHQSGDLEWTGTIQACGWISRIGLLRGCCTAEKKLGQKVFNYSLIVVEYFNFLKEL